MFVGVAWVFVYPGFAEFLKSLSIGTTSIPIAIWFDSYDVSSPGTG